MQTRTQSAIEAALNIGSGFVLSMAVWQLVGPMFGYHITLSDNFGITAVFTVVSVARSYLWRRYFNGRHHAPAL